MVSYTREEEKFIAENARGMTAQQIATALNRSKTAIHSKAKRMSVIMVKSGQNHYNSIHSNEDVDMCRTLKDEGLTDREISEKMEIPLSTVRNINAYRRR